MRPSVLIPDWNQTQVSIVFWPIGPHEPYLRGAGDLRQGNPERSRRSGQRRQRRRRL